MIEYHIGKRFPHEMYLGQGDKNMAILTSSFFNVVNVLSKLNEKEKLTYKEGELKVSLFITKNVPYIIFRLDGWGFDATINITKLEPKLLNEWLNSTANAITLMLVEADTGILEVMRLIAIPHEMADKIREVCASQIGTNMKSIDDQICLINAAIPKEMMEQNAIMNYTFSGKI